MAHALAYLLSLIAILPVLVAALFFAQIDDLQRHRTFWALIETLLLRIAISAWAVLLAIPVLLVLAGLGFFAGARWIGFSFIAIAGLASLAYLTYSLGPAKLVEGWLLTIPALAATAWSGWQLWNR